MKCVRLACAECGKEFDKEQREYNRRIRKGVNKFYCSLSCSSLNSNRVSPRSGNLENLRLGSCKDDLSPFRWYMCRCRYRACKKKEETNLTAIYLQDIWLSQNGICPLSGWHLRLPQTTVGWCKSDPLTISSASLDRIDNSKGYVQGNVRFIAVIANYARNIFTDEEVIKFGNAVAEYNKPK